MKHRITAALERFSRAMLAPLSYLSAAGLLLVVGALLTSSPLRQLLPVLNWTPIRLAGGLLYNSMMAIVNNLSIFLCVGIAAARTRTEKQEAALLALMAYLVFLTANHTTLEILGRLTEADGLTGLAATGQTSILGIQVMDTGVTGGILLGFAKYLADNHLTPARRTYVHVTVYEEVGHGGAASVPAGVTEAISVDMGCVGTGLQCTERQVSICAKDSGGPYSHEVVKKLIAAAKQESADYAVDIYPHYGSDVEATLSAGHDLRHGLIGAGVYASHGYERSHKDGVLNTLKVLKGYLFPCG